MPVYLYKAVDKQGKVFKGELEAESEIALTTELAKKGYLPVSINFKVSNKESAAKKARKLSGGTTGRIDARALVIFTRQFATIIKAGIPILEGLRALVDQAEDVNLKNALSQIIHDVESGSSLSSSLAKHPGIFSELYINTVVAGESAGILDKVLLRLSDMLEDDMETRANISAALRYPLMVVIALIIAVIVLTVFVIPQFTRMYASANAKLPLPTYIMMVTGHILRYYWYWVIISVGSLFFAGRAFISTTSGRFFWDSLKLKIPVFGKLYTKITMLRFASMLSVLYQAGLPILKTMDIVSMTIGNAVLSREIDKIKRGVADGKGISGGILDSAFFPRLVGYMVSVGEKSGSLSLMLDSLCEFFELEVRTMVKNLTSLIEPLMTAVLGFVVMGMALSIFLPMWNMVQLFKR
ncbi:MAG: type II secretion system F family protein [Candidatus Omnitrophota bacterium]